MTFTATRCRTKAPASQTKSSGRVDHASAVKGRCPPQSDQAQLKKSNFYVADHPTRQATKQVCFCQNKTFTSLS